MTRLTRRAVVVDRWDRRYYSDMLTDMAEFAAAGRTLIASVPEGGPELWADLFAAFHLVTPRLTHPDDLDPAVALNLAVVETALSLPEFSRLRIWTQGDAVVAANACITVRPTLEALHDRARAMRRLAEDLAARQQALADLPTDADDTELVRQITEADEQLRRERVAADAERTLMLRSSIGRAAREAERWASRDRMWGGSESLALPAERRLALARRMNTPAFARMADVFGALEALMAAEQRLRPSAVADDVGDVEFGRDLSRLLPSSLMLLADDATADRFYADYLQGRLPQVGRKGAEKLGRGGIVCCIDNSQSMRWPPAKEEFAKSVALVLLHLCRRQGRSFYAIHFSGTDQMQVFDFSRPYGVEQVLRFAEFFWNGCTDFVPPLRAARERLAADFERTGYTEADIVFVTDGQAHVSAEEQEEHLAEMDRIGAKTWGILLGGATGLEPLRTLCGGQVARIADVLNPAKGLRDLWVGVA